MRSAAVLAVLIGFAPVAEAQMLPPSGRAPPPDPDAVQSCVACHGARGGGVRGGDVPRIAGMPRYYLIKQLRSYADGTRPNPVMSGIARNMSEREMAFAAAYFAQADAPAMSGSRPAAPAGSTEQGRLLATVGSQTLRLQACNNCHGPGGTGEPPAIPYLAGQGAYYLMGTLNAWRAGTRRNDQGDQMAFIAKALTPEAIVAVSRYYASLSAPPPAPSGVVALPIDRQRAASRAAPTRAAGPQPALEARHVPRVDMSHADPERGRAILASGAYGCAGCHTIPGIRRAKGVTGPALDALEQRGFIAGQLPNRPEVLVAFLVDPPALVPSTGMPTTGLTREQAMHVAAYLYRTGR